MDRLNLTAQQHRHYWSWLNRPHERRVTATARRVRDGKPMGELSQVLGGNTSCDPARVPGRISEISILDESRSLRLEPGAGIPIHRQFELMIDDWRLIPELGWVRSRTHTGPVYDWKRTGDTVNAVAWGRDLYADGDAWKARSWSRKTRKALIIRELLRDSGYTQMRVPLKPGTTPQRVTLRENEKKKTKKWTVAKGASRLELINKLADSAGWIFYVTADGIPCLIDATSQAHHTLDESWLLEDPQTDYKEEFFNSWVVIGANPKGPKKKIKESRPLPAWHAQSPKSLRVGQDGPGNGEPWYSTETIENSQIKTSKDAKKLLAKKIKQAMAERTDVSISTFPIPCLTEATNLKIDTAAESFKMIRPSWTLSYTDEAMTIGGVRRTQHSPKVDREGVLL